MTGSWCEKFPTYCIKCISGRKRVEGACADPLPQTARYRIRAGQVLVDNTSVDAAALICMRRSGSSDPETCVTANEARSGKAASVPSPFTVDEITSSPGVDFRIVLGGRDIAKERGAIVHAAGLKVGALCSNVGLRGPASSATVSIYLDDP